MKKRVLAFWVVLLLMLNGCASTRTEAHKILEHTGADWFNF